MRHASIDLGIQIQSSQQTGSGALVCTRVIGLRRRENALVGKQVLKFTDTIVIYIRTRGLSRKICTSEWGVFGSKRNTSKAVQSHPIKIGSDESGLGSVYLNFSGQF
jgi:hypothetical protein